MGVYEDILDFLFDGAVPIEEIRKINDSSEMHVQGNLKTYAGKKKKAWDEKTGPEKIGVGTSVLGAVSGPAAIYNAVQSAKKNEGGMPRGALRTFGGRRGKQIAAYLDSPKSKNAKIAAGAAGVGLVGLQTANWIGDTVNSKQLSRTKSEMIDEVVKKSIHDAVNAGMSSDEIMELIEKAGYQNAAQLARTGQRLVGGALAGGAGAVGYVAGRKQTDKTVDAALDERGYTPRPVRQPLQFKPLPNTDYGIMPTVVESKYTPPKPKKTTPKKTTPKKKTQVQKNDDVDLEWEGEISKVDTDKRHVFGWCSISKVDGEPVVDRQNDYIPEEEMEKSAYEYVLHSRKGGDMHQRDGEHPMQKSDMIESMVFTEEKIEKMGLPDDFPRGWWVGFKVNDETLWEEVKDGKKVHFSVHGRGKRVKEVL